MSAEMDALVNQATEKLEHLEEALDSLQKVRARFSADDGSVTAEVDGNGALVGLWLDESITEKTAKDVGELITSASQQAALLASEKRAAVLDRLNAAF